MGSLPRLGNSYSILVYQGIRNRLNLYYRFALLCKHCLCLKRHYQYHCYSSLHKERTANIDGKWALKMPQLTVFFACCGLHYKNVMIVNDASSGVNK